MNVGARAAIQQRKQEEYKMVGKLSIYRKYRGLRSVCSNGQDHMEFRILRSKSPLPPKRHSPISAFIHLSTHEDMPSLGAHDINSHFVIYDSTMPSVLPRHIESGAIDKGQILQLSTRHEPPRLDEANVANSPYDRYLAHPNSMPAKSALKPHLTIYRVDKENGISYLH